MGVWYEEFIVKIRDKKTKEVWEAKMTFPHQQGVPIRKIEDFEIIDFKIVVG